MHTNESTLECTSIVEIQCIEWDKNIVGISYFDNNSQCDELKQFKMAQKAESGLNINAYVTRCSSAERRPVWADASVHNAV